MNTQGQADLTLIYFVNETVQKFSVLPNIFKHLLTNTELCCCNIEKEYIERFIQYIEKAIQTKETIAKPGEWIAKKCCVLASPIVGKKKLFTLSKWRSYSVIHACAEPITSTSNV